MCLPFAYPYHSRVSHALRPAPTACAANAFQEPALAISARLPFACQAHTRCAQPLHPPDAGLQLIEEVSGGKLKGGAVGSSSVVLVPGKLRCADHVADTRTAGSCMLLAQVSMIRVGANVWIGLGQ